MNLTSKLLSPLCVCYTQVCGENKSTKAVVEILSLNEIFIGKLQRYISHAVAAFSIQFNKVLINSCQIDFCLSRTESKLDRPCTQSPIIRTEIFTTSSKHFHAIAAFSIQYHKVLINSCQIGFGLSETICKQHVKVSDQRRHSRERKWVCAGHAWMHVCAVQAILTTITTKATLLLLALNERKYVAGYFVFSLHVQQCKKN